MRKSKFIHCIDSHTAGEPTRLVIDGLPVIKGNNLKCSLIHGVTLSSLKLIIDQMFTIVPY